MELDVTIKSPRLPREVLSGPRDPACAWTACCSPYAVPHRLRLPENTLGEDGDPLDAMLILDVDVVPGVLVEARPVAVFNMTDEAGGDAKVLCVPTDKRHDHIKSPADVPEQLKAEIQHFFRALQGPGARQVA